MACSWLKVRLGATALEVVPLGLAAAYGASGADVEHAFERGLNLFYWGSRRTPDFAEGLRRVAAQGRERMVLVVQTYRRSPRAIGRSLEQALRELGLDHADVLLLGWWNLPPSDAILDAAAELVHRGRARAVMLSCHHRPSFAALARDPRVQLLMLRYNAAHPGAERDVFPTLPTPRPGVVGYTSTSWGQLLDPRLTPKGERTPKGTDCYRFVLSSPFVDACYTGPSKRSELDEAVRALDQGPMSEDELAWMKRVGAAVKAGTQEKTLGIVDRLTAPKPAAPRLPPPAARPHGT
jgi:aryl-alcohol dehydrogenase-like predicted oxidoreductase